MVDKKNKDDVIERASIISKRHSAKKIDVFKNKIIPVGNKKIIRPFEIKDFSGKKTKHDVGLVRGNKQTTVKKGTKWEDIPADLQKKINWKAEYFE